VKIWAHQLRVWYTLVFPIIYKHINISKHANYYHQLDYTTCYTSSTHYKYLTYIFISLHIFISSWCQRGCSSMVFYFMVLILELYTQWSYPCSWFLSLMSWGFIPMVLHLVCCVGALYPMVLHIIVSVSNALGFHIQWSYACSFWCPGALYLVVLLLLLFSVPCSSSSHSILSWLGYHTHYALFSIYHSLLTYQHHSIFTYQTLFHFHISNIISFSHFNQLIIISQINISW